MTSVSLAQALEKDKRVEAIVLYINSPGGDALASDLMWREVKATTPRVSADRRSLDGTRGLTVSLFFAAPTDSKGVGQEARGRPARRRRRLGGECVPLSLPAIARRETW